MTCVQEYLSFGVYVLKFDDDYIVRRKPGNADYHVERRNVVVAYGFKTEGDAVRYVENRLSRRQACTRT